MKLKRFIKRKHRHIISILITIGFIICTFIFFKSSFTRIGESFRDFGTSVSYYVNEIFEINNVVNATVITKSVVPFTHIFLPDTWEEFVVLWNKFCELLFTTNNLSNYFLELSNILYNFNKFLLLVGIPLVLILILIFRMAFNGENNDYNKDSLPLKIFKAIRNNIYLPIEIWVKKYIKFLRENEKYLKIWLFIWLFNFNGFTIIVEFIAYYIYFVASFNISSIYLQVYKLFSDLSVMVAFIPLWCHFVIGYIALCYFRKKIGYSILEHLEKRNCGFINERPVCVMLVGTMGKSKTTIITDMALSEEKILRNKAFEKLLAIDMKFPYFPWVNLENVIKYAIEKRHIYNLASCRQFIDKIHELFILMSVLDEKSAKSIRKHLQKEYGFNYKKHLFFDYDAFNYSVIYNDNLKVELIWDTIKTYAELYFVYIVNSSLVISNYSIRTDNIFIDKGNLPLWDTSFIKRNSMLIKKQSKYSHIIDFDMLRLGKKMVEDNEKKDCFEFGVVNITEIGKERKNQLELKETKINENVANQKNDGFTSELKMIRHSSTIDYYPFVKVISDEQRPESLGADARDLCEIVYIKNVEETRLAMPFFSLYELIYSFVYKNFISLYVDFRHNRGDNTLLVYLLKLITSKINNYYVKIYNTFGVKKVNLEVENGTLDGVKNDKKYYLMNKKIYSNRFSTDCFSDFFAEKALKTRIGINDLETYKTEKASFEELKKQNSYFISELIQKRERSNYEKDKSKKQK